MKDRVSVKTIIEFIESNGLPCKYEGDVSAIIEGVSPITNYRINTLTWIKSIETYQILKEKIETTKIQFLVADEDTKKYIQFENAFIGEKPRNIFYMIVKFFFTYEELENKIGENTFIDESAIVGKNVFIGNNCYIGKNATIGDCTKIYHNVVVCANTYIGKNCLIKSGAVIGEEGHGYVKNEDKYYRIPHIGSVRIENNVDIGAGTCIDRGNMEDTFIGAGTKIDSLCYIAHNVRIGKNVFVASGNKILGGVCIGEESYLASGVVIRNRIHIGEKSMVGMGSIVVKDVESGYIYVGNPARKVKPYRGECF